MNNPKRILITDDESGVREMLEEYLQGHGYVIHSAASAAQAREIISQHSVDLALLDVRMPGEDGLSLARHLREHYNIGIIMLTAAGETMDKVLGLEIGADDYVVKPFDPRELLARVKSVLRRGQADVSSAVAQKQAKDKNIVRFGLCLLDLERHRLTTLESEEITITSSEYDTLKAFAENPNKALSRERLLNLTQHRDWDPFDRSIDIRITRLRKKIEPDPSKPQVIKTIRNAGYLFVCEE
ncbi:MAG: response regulator [Gammaproteobacteria bacterium]|nr:response regulator [Gammaproteobacteria bacterium]